MIKTDQFRLLTSTKDGGDESHVTAYWLFAWKKLCSVGLLKFEDGSGEAFHEHAFNSVSWVLNGALCEVMIDGSIFVHVTGDRVRTHRETFHGVHSVGTTWVLTFRGPWVDTWREFLPKLNIFRTLTHGRKEV